MPVVVGCGRSGTTLLRTMFSSHPDLAMSVGQYPLDLWRVRARYEREGGFDLARFAEDLLAVRQFVDMGIDPERLRASLHGVQSVGYGEAWRRVLALYAAAKGKHRYGHKNPGFVEHLGTVASWWPEARFVHIHRDGRDVALSMVEQGWGPNNVAGAARWWATRVAAGRRGGDALGPDRYLEVRYEELVADPEAALRRICRFVALEYRPEMLGYQHEALESIPERFRHRHGHLTEAPRLGIRDWRRDMPARSVGVFEAVAGPELSTLGYERSFPSVPAAARLEARSQLAASAVRMRLKGSPAARRLYRALRRGRPAHASSAAGAP